MKKNKGEKINYYADLANNTLFIVILQIYYGNYNSFNPPYKDKVAMSHSIWKEDRL